MDRLIIIPEKTTQKKTKLYRNEELSDSFQKDWLKTSSINPQNDMISKSIKRKLSGYRQQDIKRGFLDHEKFISYEECLQLLSNPKEQDASLCCHYCLENIKLIYNVKRDKKQWTLDRLDNFQGHNFDNVVICCLECNLKKRRLDEEKFIFEKQFNLVKI